MGFCFIFDYNNVSTKTYKVQEVLGVKWIAMDERLKQLQLDLKGANLGMWNSKNIRSLA